MESQKQIQIFNNAEFGEIRSMEIGGEPWFVGKDVAAALGYTNPQKAIRDHVDVEDKTVNESLSSSDMINTDRAAKGVNEMGTP